jgi:hypothetical protein
VRRWLVTILLFLLLVSGGAIVNVAVAWGCAWYWGGGREGLYARPDGGLRLRNGRSILAHAYSRPGASEVYVWLSVYGLREDPRGSDPIDHMTKCGPVADPWARLVELESRFQTRHVMESWTEWASGWPFLACGGYHSRRIQVFEDGTRDIALQSHGVLSGDGILNLHPGWTDPEHVVVPYHPIWAGFAGNTVFYAMILWLLIPGPFLLRRHIRRRRGRCVKCGYDLRGDLAHGCPECGWKRQPEATA